jgi:Spy/CpxP family protein refolding chaperone
MERRQSARRKTMTHKKTIISIVSILALALIAVSTTAGEEKNRKKSPEYEQGNSKDEYGFKFGRGKGHRFNGDGPRFDGRRLDRMAQHLNLTEAQQQQIKKIHESAREDSEDLRVEIQALRKKMQEQWQASKPDEGAILALQEEIHKLKGKLQEIRIQTRLDVFSILTAEQQEIMRSNMKMRRGGRGHGFMGKGKKGGGSKGKGSYGHNRDKGTKRSRSNTQLPERLA